MIAWFQELDAVLRGQIGKSRDLLNGVVPVSGRRLLAVNVLLGLFAGLCVGLFGVFNREVPEFRQPIAAMIKVPALFLLALFVTFPSLYVFNALIGSRLGAVTLGRLMMATLGITSAVLASFGPIIAFFSLTTNNYPFILLMNVIVFAVSGLLGMNFLFRTMYRMTEASEREVEPEPLPTPAPAFEEFPRAPVVTRAPRLTTDEQRVRRVFIVWVIVFALVGMQMSWVLRPFLGHPDLEFTWFRPRSSSFIEAVMGALRKLLGT